MELADDIAYGIHDLEDAIVMGMVEQSQFSKAVVQPIQALDIPWLSENIQSIPDKLFSSEQHIRKNTIGALVNSFITSIYIVESEQFEHPLLRYKAAFPAPFNKALDVFKRFVYQYVIRKPGNTAAGI